MRELRGSWKGGKASIRVRICGQGCGRWEVHPLGPSEKCAALFTHGGEAGSLIPQSWPPLLGACSQGGKLPCTFGLRQHKGRAGVDLGEGSGQTDTGWDAGGAKPV